jgi:MoaA/NifB/PqqE/SkfB family radical SAM enzyme
VRTDERRPAVQGKKDLEVSRLAYALESMPHNKAYRYAAERAGGDADGQVLALFRDRFTQYRKGWRGNARFAVENGLHDEYYARTGWGPLSLDIEVAAICDLACPFCYRQAIATPDKTITDDLFYRVMDQGAELGVPSVKFNWRGEPLLHPRLPALIDYAKQKSVLETIINTDAVTLTEEKSEALIDAGLDLIVYSFDGGTKETYEKMRPGRFKTNHFEDVYANIQRFAEIRARKGARFPRTKIQMVLTADTFREQEQFFDLFAGCVDDVSVKAYTERGGELPELDAAALRRVHVFLRAHSLPPTTAYWRDMTGAVYVGTGRLPCEQLYQRLMVTYDGRISMCCYDWGVEYPIGYVDEAAYRDGDADYEAAFTKSRAGARGFERLTLIEMPARYIEPPRLVQTLREIWDGEILNQVRRLHLKGDLDAVPICKKCMFKETYEWMRVPDAELQPAG